MHTSISRSRGMSTMGASTKLFTSTFVAISEVSMLVHLRLTTEETRWEGISDAFSAWTNRTALIGRGSGMYSTMSARKNLMSEGFVVNLPTKLCVCVCVSTCHTMK